MVKAMCFSLGAVLLFATPGTSQAVPAATQEGQQAPDVPLPGPTLSSVDGPLNLEPLRGQSFLRPGRLLVAGTVLAGLPFDVLYLLHPQASWQALPAADAWVPAVSLVQAPSALRGHVEIATPRAALEYARFLTSPLAGGQAYFSEWYEVVPVSTAAEALLCGRDASAFLGLGVSPGQPAPQYGIVSDAVWREGALSTPEVRGSAVGYEVRRCMIEGPGRHLSPDGREATMPEEPEVWDVTQLFAPDGLMMSEEAIPRGSFLRRGQDLRDAGGDDQPPQQQP